ncbi:MAG TPA: DUF998 domain-containing protein [Chloroflexota bacterium]
MIQPITSTSRPVTAAEDNDGAFGPTTETTKKLLSCLLLAGPLFVVVAVIQIFTRPGFDLTRHALSLLTIGSWGWVQSSNFVVTGLLTIAGAMGVRRVLRGGSGGRWAPILLTVCGVGFVGGGLFHPDPSNGFPPGTPAGASAVMSWHGVLHMVCGSLAFLALVALSFVLARSFSRAGQRRWAVSSRIAGSCCAVGIATAGAPGGTVSMFIGVSLALLWVSLIAGQMIAGLRGAQIETRSVETEL